MQSPRHLLESVLFRMTLPAVIVVLLAPMARAAEPAPLGVHPQLVVDDALIAAKQGVTRKAHACRKLPKPVLEGEKPWESQRVYVYGTVLRDPATREFRMWYMGRNQDGPAIDPRLTYSRYDHVLYATSSDGITWTRPSLRLYEYGGSSDNNIVFGMHSPSIMFDAKDPDPSRRYKMLGCGKGKNAYGYCGATSPDGLHWQGLPDNPLIKASDTITLSYDSARGEYLAFHKISGDYRGHKRRLVYLATSRDFRTWSESQLVLAPDEQDDAWATEPDQRTEFYNLSVFEYAGQFLGMVTVFKHHRTSATRAPGQSRDDGPIDVQLVHSRDGHHWQRLEDRSPIIPNGPYAYDAGSILGVCNSPVVDRDEMAVYYTAITTTHGGALPEKKLSIARAAWPKDRLVSLDAAAEGSVETVCLNPVGDRLRVNADASAGSLGVEVLGDDGQVIPGYSAADCRSLTGDGLDRPVQWKDHETLPADRPIRLRFLLKQASLYAFAISDKE